MNEITIMSFGYLYGAPEEADTVIGTRGLPNPYYVEALRRKTGLDREIRDYVFSTPEAERYFETVLSLLRQRITFYNLYDSPLKTSLVIAVGCTGGKHRSVSLAVRLAAALEAEGVAVRVIHRDLDKRLEHCAGAVVYTREAGELRYLILHTVSGRHGFPKGCMEPGETEAETALREIREETGLSLALQEGFRTVDVYRLPNQPNTWKQVVWYLAEYRDQPLRPAPEEIRCTALLPYGEALQALEHESERRVLKEANDFLNR